MIRFNVVEKAFQTKPMEVSVGKRTKLPSE